MTTPKSTGRPPKGKETRKAVTFRLQPSTIALIQEAAVASGISQSDLIESLVKGCRLFSCQVFA